MLRRFAVAILLAAALPLAAQPLPKLEPVPEPPPPPPGVSSDPAVETPVRIQPGATEQVEEQIDNNGQRVVRVTTPSGAVYYIHEDLNNGVGTRNESLDRGIRVPAWVIRQF
jgi:hypothetical protein